jgi:AcrR family transcriptional regulator
MEPAAERIQAAALALFAERGFHGTGIRDLAERAGLSSATLYHYMGTKEDLLVRIMRQSLERLLAAGRQLDGSPPERVAGLVHLHVLTHATWRLETQVVDGEMRALSEVRHREIVSLRDDYETLWLQAIEDGCSGGFFGVRDPRMARLALLEMCSGVARWYQPQGPISLEELALRYGEMALGLLGSEPVLPSAAVSVRRASELIAAIWPAGRAAVDR